jgi:hypothetical protein
MEMVWALLIFFIFVTMLFVVIALMFPEWVGITGKKALEVQKHQRGDEHEEPASSETTKPAASPSPSTEKKPPQ